MLILLILLACLVSILCITLFKIESVNQQVILFQVVLILVLAFKLVFDYIINNNKQNPVSNNILNNVNSNSQSINNVLPKNFNKNINNVNGLDTILNNPNVVLCHNFSVHLQIMPT